MATLVLNADMNVLQVNPLSVISWQNAVKLYYTGALSVVEEYDDWYVNSPSHRMRVPSVMALKSYIHINHYIAFSDENLLVRDGRTCQYCGGKFKDREFTKDHVKPRSKGGKTTWENIVLSCGPCNHARGNNENIRPRREPYKPTVHEFNAKLAQNPVVAQHESWVPYLALTWDKSKIILPNR